MPITIYFRIVSRGRIESAKTKAPDLKAADFEIAKTIKTIRRFRPNAIVTYRFSPK